MSTAQVYKSKREGSAKAGEMISEMVKRMGVGVDGSGISTVAHRVVFAVLTEDLGSNPALSARNPRPSAETVAAHRQLLTQAKV